MSTSEKKTDKRNLIQKGEVRNPKGRPRGVSITKLVQEELDKVPPGKKEKAKRLLAKKIVKKALDMKDFKWTKEIWHRIDGDPNDYPKWPDFPPRNTLNYFNFNEEEGKEIAKKVEKKLDE